MMLGTGIAAVVVGAVALLVRSTVRELTGSAPGGAWSPHCKGF